MATFYGIERNTDLNAPETAITRLPSERAARKWVQRDQRDQGFAFPGSARQDLPVSQQNWHRRIRWVLVMPPGFRLSKRELHQALSLRRRHSSRFLSENDVRADLLTRYADDHIYSEPAKATP